MTQTPRQLAPNLCDTLFGGRSYAYGFELKGAADEGACTIEELSLVAKAHPRRRQTFIAGRACAKACLTLLNPAPEPLLRRASGEPDWPDGVAGSIAHVDGYAFAAIIANPKTHLSLGIDVERVDAVSGAVTEEVLTRVERAQLVGAPTWMASAIFSAKEAFYKAQFPVTGAWLDFHDVEISIGDACLLLTPASSARPVTLARTPLRVGLSIGEHLVRTAVLIKR